MLGDEHWMLAVWRLFAVVGGKRRGQALLDEHRSMLEHCLQTASLKVQQLTSAQAKAPAER